jgi:hypothetical protein
VTNVEKSGRTFAEVTSVNRIRNRKPNEPIPGANEKGPAEALG